MNNLKNTELLTFLYMFRSFIPGFIAVSTENYRGMAHIIKKTVISIGKNKEYKKEKIFYMDVLKTIHKKISNQKMKSKERDKSILETDKSCTMTSILRFCFYYS